MSDVFRSDVGGTNIHKEALDVGAAVNSSTIYIYALLLNIIPQKNNTNRLFVHLMPKSAYLFPAPDGTLVGRGVKYTYVIDKGNDNLNRIVPPVNDYWKYTVKLEVTNTANEPNVVKATTGEIVLNPHLSGRNLDKKPTASRNSTDTNIISDAKMIEYLVNLRHSAIKNSGINWSKAPRSIPKPNSSEGKLYTHKVKLSGVELVKNDISDIKAELSGIGIGGINERIRYQYKNSYHSFPGGRVTTSGVETHDNNGGVISKKAKFKYTSSFTNIEHRKAAWDRVKMRGRRMNALLSTTPSTLLQPIKQFVKSIGDVEDLAISALMSIYAILSLGDFKPTSSGKEAIPTSSNRQSRRSLSKNK